MSDSTQKPVVISVDTIARTFMEQLGIPGASLVIVDASNVLFEGHFGLRDVEQDLPVTTKTVFPIASLSKTFTAATLSRLNDSEILDWDAPVAEYMPAFRLSERYQTDSATSLDFATHRTGLCDYSPWFYSPYSRSEFLERLRYTPLIGNFRELPAYQNMNYLVLGALVD